MTQQLPSSIRDRIRLLIFDLDGVITSEWPYWEAARLTVHEIIEENPYLGQGGYFAAATPEKWGEQIIPVSMVYEIKNRAVNSNWDLTFITASLYFVDCLNELRAEPPTALADILKAGLPPENMLRSLGQRLPGRPGGGVSGQQLIERFLRSADPRKGAAVLDYIETFSEETLGLPLPFLRHQGEFWTFCQGRFQEWLLVKPRPAFVAGPREQMPETVVDSGHLNALVHSLHSSGRFVLGVATGRPWLEAGAPLRALGILDCFERERIVTNEAVVEAEAILAERGEVAALGKPHPFILLKAIHPELSSERLCTSPPSADHRYAAYIGDAPSDIGAAKRAGCISLGVLTGVPNEGSAREARRKALTALGCDLVMNSVLDLPEVLGLEENAHD